MKRSTRWTIAAILLLVLVAAAMYFGKAGSVSSNSITISKETTYITAPLRPDGRVDYAAALNQRCSEGVTPENNAAVLFWQAVGPADIPEAKRAKFFEMLGIAPPPENGDYAATLKEFADRLWRRAKSELPPQEDPREVVPSQFDKAVGRPWSREEFPTLADWLATNEKPLALIVEGCSRPRCYDPVICSGKETLLDVPRPWIVRHREFAKLLTLRAMLRLGEGKLDETWADLLNCRRLARLAGQEPTMIDALVATSIDTMAAEGETVLLQDSHLSAAQIATMRADLDQLAPMPVMAERLDVAERFQCLDSISQLAKDTSADRDVMLRLANAWYDRLVGAYRQPTRAERNEALQMVEYDLDKMASKSRDWKSLLASLLWRGPREVLSETIGQVVVRLALPGASSLAKSEDRWQMTSELHKLAFALAAYRADQGAYPAKLADLVPKYVAEVPQDIFNEAELHYGPEEGGYLLYSVGPNGKDDGGKTYAERTGDEGWDDVTVRIPASKP